MDRSEHTEAVHEFMKQCQRDNPEQYARVCEQFPIIGNRQWRRIREREVPYTALDFEELYSADTRLDQED